MRNLPNTWGPYLAKDFRSGDPYELSHGRAIQCFPTGARGSKAEGAGYKAISTDPDVQDVGIDTGFSPAPDSLRAPDIAVGLIPDEAGWVKGVPRMALEYADVGQDEVKLAEKIEELLEKGTELIWVIRLTGPRRVEVHRLGRPMELGRPGEQLEAPGILRRPLPVDALYDEKVSNQVAFRNLLEKEAGYRSLDEVRQEGRVEGELETLRSALLAIFDARQIEMDDEVRTGIATCRDRARLQRWLIAASTASSPSDIPKT